jgi:hypothetical protein
MIFVLALLDTLGSFAPLESMGSLQRQSCFLKTIVFFNFQFYLTGRLPLQCLIETEAVDILALFLVLGEVSKHLLPKISL